MTPRAPRRRFRLALALVLAVLGGARLAREVPSFAAPVTSPSASPTSVVVSRDSSSDLPRDERVVARYGAASENEKVVSLLCLDQSMATITEGGTLDTYAQLAPERSLKGPGGTWARGLVSGGTLIVAVDRPGGGELLVGAHGRRVPLKMRVNAFALGPGGLAVVGNDERTALWNVTTSEEIDSLQVAACSASFSRDGPNAFFIGTKSGELLSWTVGGEHESLGHVSEPIVFVDQLRRKSDTGLEGAPNLVFVTSSYKLGSYDFTKKKLTSRLLAGSRPVAAVLHDDQLFIASEGETFIHVFDAQALEARDTISIGHTIAALAFDAKGRLCAASPSGTISVVRLER